MSSNADFYIRDAKQLRDLCSQAKEDGVFGFDVEFIRERTYYPRLALIQLAVRDELWLLDPIAITDLEPFEALVADPDVEKILHAASQDLEIFFHRTDQSPRNIFDTQIAAALVGRGNQIAYGRLVFSVLGIQPKQGESFTDWLKRPLSAKQEHYALEDVRHLFELRARLGDRLAELGREEWVREECRRYEKRTFFVPDPEFLFKRVKRNGVLKPRGLAVLRELAKWREDEARYRDRPRRQVVSDEVLVELARMAPEKQNDLERFRGLHPRVVQRSGAQIVAAIGRGNAVPDAELPQRARRERLSEDAELAVDFVDTCLRSFAKDSNIASSYIATRSDMEQLVGEYFGGRFDATKIPMLQGWRGDLVGNDIIAVLEGRVSVKLDPETGRPQFEHREA